MARIINTIHKYNIIVTPYHYTNKYLKRKMKLFIYLNVDNVINDFLVNETVA